MILREFAVAWVEANCPSTDFPLSRRFDCANRGPDSIAPGPFSGIQGPIASSHGLLRFKKIADRVQGPVRVLDAAPEKCLLPWRQFNRNIFGI